MAALFTIACSKGTKTDPSQLSGKCHRIARTDTLSCGCVIGTGIAENDTIYFKFIENENIQVGESLTANAIYKLNEASVSEDWKRCKE